MIAGRIQKLNVIAFMITSFSCYQGAQRGGIWLGLGPVTLAVHIGLFLPVTPRKLIRSGIALMVGVSGFLLETVLIAVNVYTVQATSRWVIPAPLCPEWILVLWMNFGFMLYVYRGFLTQKPWVAPLTGTVFSLIIMGNASRMGLIIFESPMVLKYLIIAVCWAVIVPLQACLANRVANTRGNHADKQV